MIHSLQIIVFPLLILWFGALVAHGQLTFFHEFTTSSFVTIQDENEVGDTFDYFAFEGITSSERIQFKFSNVYDFQQISVTNGWQFFDDPTANGTITRSYYFGGLDGGIGNESFNFDTPFNLNFDLLKTFQGQTGTTHDIDYFVTVRIMPDHIVGNLMGDFNTTLIDPYAVPEPSTYALIIGLASIIPVLWLKCKKRAKDEGS